MIFRRYLVLFETGLFITFLILACGPGLCGKDGCSNSSGTSGALQINLSKPVHNRSFFVDDEVGPRSLQFSHNGDSVECSTDGINYSSCTTNGSYVWNVSQYSGSVTIYIRASRGADVKVKTYNPATEHPGLTFLTCDIEVTTNDTFANFQTTVSGVGNDVICISDGVNITNPNFSGQPRISVGDANRIIIVRSGETATLNNQRTDGASAVDRGGVGISGVSGVHLIGINIQTAGNAAIGVFVDNGDSTYIEGVTITTNAASTSATGLEITNISTGVEFRNSTIQTLGGYGIQLFSSSTITIVGATVNTTGISNNTRGINTNGNTNISISDSNFTMSGSGADVLNLDATTVTADNSVFSQSGSSGYAIFLSTNSSSLNLSNSIVESGTATDPMINLVNNVTLTLSNNTFKKLDTGSANIYAIGDGSASAQVVNASPVPTGSNIFCHINLGLGSFTGVYNDTGTANAGSFDPSGLSISSCL